MTKGQGARGDDTESLDQFSDATDEPRLALRYLTGFDDDDPHAFSPIELLQKVLREVENHGCVLSDSVDEAYARVAHLDGKEVLTEDEEQEYAASVGWVDDAAAEHRAHREVIAESILIVASKMIETRISAGAGAISPRVGMLSAKKVKKKIDQTKDKLCCLGPRVRGVPWAEGVRVGGNYVRHREEWRVGSHEPIVLDNETYYRRRSENDLINALPDGRQRQNAKVLVDLGIPPADFLVHGHEVGFRLVSILGLHEMPLPMFGEWMVEVVAFLTGHERPARAPKG